MVIEDYILPDTGIESYVWIPPIEYISPEINYEIIWKYLDYEFHKHERPYIYNSKMEGGPSIEFYNISKLLVYLLYLLHEIITKSLILKKFHQLKELFFLM